MTAGGWGIGSNDVTRRDLAEGEWHRHDRMNCWDCGGVGIVANAISHGVLHSALRAIGWRYVDGPDGPMRCPECHWKRRYPQGKLPSL